MQDQKLHSLLAFAGALPFLACAILPWVGIDAIAPFGQLDAVAASYGLAIVCFLAGAHWATFLYRAAEAPLNLLVTSNVVLVAVWLVFIGANTGWQLLTESLALVLLLVVDHRLLRTGLISSRYFKTRVIATALATGSLLVIVLGG